MCMDCVILGGNALPDSVWLLIRVSHECDERDILRCVK